MQNGGRHRNLLKYMFLEVLMTNYSLQLEEVIAISEKKKHLEIFWKGYTLIMLKNINLYYSYGLFSRLMIDILFVMIENH